MSSAVSSIPQLLALDWGTSSLRAFLMRDGNVTETRSSAHGIQHLPLPGVPGYEKAFAEIAGDWLKQWPTLPIVACGMSGVPKAGGRRRTSAVRPTSTRSRGKALPCRAASARIS